MRKILLLLSVASTFQFSSCGPSDAEKAAEEKARQDSLAKVNQRFSQPANLILDSLEAISNKAEKIRVKQKDSITAAENAPDD